RRADGGGAGGATPRLPPVGRPPRVHPPPAVRRGTVAARPPELPPVPAAGRGRLAGGGRVAGTATPPPAGDPARRDRGPRCPHEPVHARAPRPDRRGHEPPRGPRGRRHGRG